MKDRSVRKENDRLARGSEGSLHVPADGYVITECGGGRGGGSECGWPRLGRAAYTPRAT